MKKKQVRISTKSTMCLIQGRPSITNQQESNLWYSTEDTDRFKAWQSHRVQDIRWQLQENSALLEEGSGFTISAAAILGLEKYLTPELTEEYKVRREVLQRAVLEEHRRQCVMMRSSSVPQSTVRLAMISAKHSEWARERARAAALFLEQEVLQDLKEMNLLRAKPLRCSMSRLNKVDAVKKEEGCKGRPYQRR